VILLSSENIALLSPLRQDNSAIFSRDSCAFFPFTVLELLKMTSDIGRALAAMRQRRKRTCPICGTAFEAYGRQIYDKPACAKKAWRLREKAKRGESD
jgi:hypothetical protein